MKLEFVKMHGAGNDFIVADNSASNWPLSGEFITAVCDRLRGIGADGLILLSKKESSIRMNFYNCDGSSAEMCGNGLRCAALFASRHLDAGNRIDFDTDAGVLHTELVEKNTVRIELPVIEQFKEVELSTELKLYKGNTGVPHAIKFVDDINSIDIIDEGAFIRFHEKFLPEGTNVNFAARTKSPDSLYIRTYERGVENETAACGTGIAAAGICAVLFMGFSSPVKFITPDNDVLCIELQMKDDIVNDVKLTGPAEEVFSGTLTVN